ncbi:hypothetical protein [Paraburkholderia bannensis]|uniref:hypothetical protein n=1 Tax=Paraburkholderia bannensis TaxID=765414 RepID=UPI002AB70961|nr:hypothetical protein [Paraburkholderia bannensis]
MSRFDSLDHAPAQTRITLRQRFSRNLKARTDSQLITADDQVIEDESVLELFMHLEIQDNTDPENARTLYEIAREKYVGQLSFDELIERGWILQTWGVVYSPRDFFMALRQQTEDTMPALKEWLDARYDLSYKWNAEPTGERTRKLVESVVSRTVRPDTIVCRSPGWVAARLWERLPSSPLAPLTRLHRWAAAWRLLRHPQLILSDVWAEADRATFVEAALYVLEEGAGFPSWKAFRTRGIQMVANSMLREPVDYERYLPEVPDTLLDRALWLKSRVVERPAFWALEAWSNTFGLARILLDDVSATTNSLAVHPVAARVFRLAERCPDVLNFLLHYMPSRPRLLADMMMTPEWAALGCLLISEWNMNTGAWDRDVERRDHEIGRDTAFADAMSILAWHLHNGQLAPAELASLMRELHARSAPGNIVELQGTETMLVALRSVVVTQPKAILVEVFDALTRSDGGLKLGHAAFSAALDLIDCGQFTEDVRPEVLPMAYISSVLSDDFGLSASRVSAEGAAALYMLAQKLDAAEANKFLFPFNVRESLETSENIYSARDSLAHAVQIHMRVLARAVVGLSSPVPDALFKALVKTVRTGASASDNKGHVAAMAIGFEAGPSRGRRDRALAVDLAAALNVFDDAHASQLLDDILSTDEPAFLAQFLSAAPKKFKPQIEKRLEKLAPEDAGEAHWRTDRFVRIDTLLSAGALDAAAAFIEAERQLPEEIQKRTALARFRGEMRLAFLRQDWQTVETAVVPLEMSVADQNEAKKTILFFQGAAHIVRDDGNPDYAKQIFATLYRSKPTESAYAYNLFAAKVRAAVGNDMFVRLHGDALKDANQALAETASMEASFRQVAPESDAYITNKATLLLAANRSIEAEQLIRPIFAARINERVAALTAVALVRMGRNQEGQEALDWAETRLGTSELLMQTRGYLSDGGFIEARVEVSGNDNPLPSIKEAIGNMLRLNPFEQAEVWRGQPSPFNTFVIEQVRHAAASVISLVSVMRNVQIDSCEDDISAVVRELLTSRLAFVGWAVPDQSKGGFTDKGNPAERDLLIKKDSSELVSMEAVVCDRNPGTEWTKDELKSHFQKLLASSTCKLFFHLTYAYKGPISEILNELSKLAREDAPEGFTFADIKDVAARDSGPSGLVAQYRTDTEDVNVVFLVLDMSQSVLRNAAKLAETNSARRSKSTSK